MGVCYVYGVVEREVADRDLGSLPAVGDAPGTAVTYVTQGSLAAAVSDLRTERPLGTADDLRVHARVLDAIAATGVPVVPFRFGTVLPDERAVAHDVLADGQDVLTTALNRLRGRAQFTLRAAYERDALLREARTAHPPPAEDHPVEPAPHAPGEELAEPLPAEARPGEAAPRVPGERVRRADLLAGAIEARRATDADLLHGSLAPLALAARSAEPEEEDGLVDVSFLVEDARRDEFEQAVEELSRDWHGRVRLRLLGPLAPYDFAADAATPDPAW